MLRHLVRRRPNLSVPRVRLANIAVCSLVVVAAASWACSDTTHDVCERAIGRQVACDPTLAAGEPQAIATCSLQLDSEPPSCREAARRLANCVAQSSCAEANDLCLGSGQGVALNCSHSPFSD